MYPRHRHVIVCLVVLSAAISVMAAACGGSGGPAASPVADRVVAIVNGHVVHESDVALVRAEKRLVGQAATAPAALNEAIDRELLRREAARLGVVADAAIVARRMTEMATQVGGAAALKTSLGRAAMSVAQLRRSITDGVLREAVQNAKFPKVAAGAQAARVFYDRHRKGTFTEAATVHLGAIPVRTRMVAENALGRLRQGRPFAEVAHEFSIDPESRDAGGDLGLLLTSSLPGPLQKAATSAHAGLFAEPVQVGNIWYVLDILARRPARAIPFAKVRARLQQELTQIKRGKALEAWLAAARKHAVVERL